jgi:hypothetical protein
MKRTLLTMAGIAALSLCAHARILSSLNDNLASYDANLAEQQQQQAQQQYQHEEIQRQLNSIQSDIRQLNQSPPSAAPRYVLPSPEYMTQVEARQKLEAGAEAYLRDYRARHGCDSSGRPWDPKYFPGVTKQEVLPSSTPTPYQSTEPTPTPAPRQENAPQWLPPAPVQPKDEGGTWYALVLIGVVVSAATYGTITRKR